MTGVRKEEWTEVLGNERSARRRNSFAIGEDEALVLASKFLCENVSELGSDSEMDNFLVAGSNHGGMEGQIFECCGGGFSSATASLESVA